MTQRSFNREAGRPRVTTMLPAAGVLLLIFSFFLVMAPGVMAKDREEVSVLQAARIFLDAEVRGDHRVVYECFAPSSPYVRDNSYEDYLRQTRSSEDRLESYRIVEVTYVLDNEDRESWPGVEKFAQVEVELVFLDVLTERRSEINIGFIFMKEGGKWYKS